MKKKLTPAMANLLNLGDNAEIEDYEVEYDFEVQENSDEDGQLAEESDSDWNC